MPLSEGDVLLTLSDHVSTAMNFWIGPVHISGRAYGTIRDHIKVGNILVVGGTSTLAFYDSKTDILTTQIGNSPANLDQRALLLHECTHALMDVFTYSAKVTRHIDELASYVAQHVYLLRSNPASVSVGGSGPWPVFFSSVVALIKAHGLDTAAGNGKRIGVDVLEPLRVQLAALPHVNYGSFHKDDATGADGLIRNHPFLTETPPNLTGRTHATAQEPYPEPNDDYLIRTLLQQYVASDVAGYGKRLRELRRDFAKCSTGRARELARRLAVRRSGDRLSELFHDRLSTAGRAILLRVLRQRV